MNSTIQVEIAAGLIIALLAFMQWYGKLPTMKAVSDLAAVLNSRGGNILVLGAMAMFFFMVAVRFVYYVIGLSIGGKVDLSDSMAMAAFTWITGAAFGGAFTSMVKAMTGEDAPKNSTPPITPTSSGGGT